MIKEPLSVNQNQDEFVRLLSANTTRLLSFIRVLVFNNEDDAEEVFQRTCLVLWKKFDQYDSDGNFGAWACRIAYFEMLRYRQGNRRLDFVSVEAIEALAAAAYPIADRVSERRIALSECLRKLNDSDFHLITSRYFDGESVQSLSERVNRSTHAIYRELSHIHGLLANCIDAKLSGVRQ